MVKITSEMLLKYASHTKKMSSESDLQYFKRLTHIYLQEKNIEEIDNLAACKNLTVLYLYDNNISVIKNLAFATNLTHLYLQKNNISHLTGLKHMPKLMKLYLGHNSITVVEGLDGNQCLVELHIESQNLPPGEKLLFDPSTMEAISKSLSVLNISNNNIDDTNDLKILRKLNHLMIADNKLYDWVDLSETLLEWPSLYNLEISGNPVCRHKKFRDKLIIMSKSLVMIDSKEVTESNRQFLQNWYANKEAKRQLKKQLRQQTESYDFMVKSVRDSNRLYLNYPYSKDTSLYRLQESTRYGFQPITNKHISKPHKQFAEVLAKAKDGKYLPPLEQARARYREESFHSELPAISHVMHENKPL
ncbi:protein phosphatase 1 regulatory subunit 42-like [Hydractinia symbiolongicarpus]|uniref:protein phosphatase 1 regulatory subunit 42-like n=1 Tax=Hydractinia symbiolongicarpus TaxID=13093 RepID=UPI00254E18DB|nr:protein phosphatase 1 regulatory subunit 42-like [Hydractinia symbiolongicarpus]XP_057312633.1 protein phosphatase 1 regulatory subunit 42-like [Hydractinia symbiolongicarpus]